MVLQLLQRSTSSAAFFNSLFKGSAEAVWQFVLEAVQSARRNVAFFVLPVSSCALYSHVLVYPHVLVSSCTHLFVSQRSIVPV